MSDKQNPNCCKFVWRNWDGWLQCLCPKNPSHNFSYEKCMHHDKECKDYERRYDGDNSKRIKRVAKHTG